VRAKKLFLIYLLIYLFSCGLTNGSINSSDYVTFGDSTSEERLIGKKRT